MRRELLSSIDNITIDFKRYLDKEVLDICSTKCKPDCNTRQYLTESKVYHQNKPWQQLAIVILQHSSTPDIIVRHSLEISLMSFVCNSGGLLGMWLGFSLISISKDIFESFSGFSILNRNQIDFIHFNKYFNFNNFNLNFNKKSKLSSNLNTLPIVQIH